MVQNEKHSNAKTLTIEQIQKIERQGTFVDAFSNPFRSVQLPMG
jgi:hypothetical protein